MSKRFGNLAVFCLLIVDLLVCAAGSRNVVAQINSDRQDSARMQWWRDARFGMFIHWGIYAVPAQGEWYMTNAHVPRTEYEKYAGQFDPTEFDADRWVKIAHDAGMKYLVITSKHHDGFCMFETKASNYSVVNTPWHKDPLKALSAACRRYGIKFAVYYSIMDWHSPDQEADNPDPQQPTYNPTHFKPGEKEAYIEYMKTQLKELVTRYHPAILWFDGGWMNGWTDEDGQAIYSYLHKLDPKLIINNRVIGAGDYETPEQEIPPNGIPGHDWETCMTINDNWGYSAGDSNFKSVEGLLRNLIDIASKGGNYLLNVGPTAQGVIPQPEVDRLEAMGRWLKVNGESIYGTTASPFTRQLLWGRCTQKPGKLFFNVFNWPADGKLVVHGLYSQPQSACLLVDKKKTPLKVEREEDALVISVPSKAPDEISGVVQLAFSGRPIIYNPPTIESQTNILIDSLGVNVSSETGAEVCYATDGSTPTVKSPMATGTIKLTETTVLTARCFRDGQPVSETAREVFTKVKPEPAVTPENVQNGLSYGYYEGMWDSLPDFDKLTPLRKGILPNFALPQQRASVNFGVVYIGYIKVPKEGIYSLYTASDDGSRLYIGNKLVVDNDGLHGMKEREGIVALSTGYHPIRVEYFQRGGDVGLSVYYKSADNKRQSIPDALLYFNK